MVRHAQDCSRSVLASLAGEASNARMSMSSSPDSSHHAGDISGAQAARAIVEGLQNEISPERIARRIRDMVEATCPGPHGTECPDWRTIEVGVKLYLALLCPSAVDNSPLPTTQAQAPTGNRASHGAAPSPGLQNNAAGGGMQIPRSGRDASSRQVERQEFIRRMMVLDPDVLASRRDADGRPIPRRSQPVSPSLAPSIPPAVRPDAFDHLPAPKIGPPPPRPAGKWRWIAMLAGCLAIVWMAGNSLREPASPQPVAQHAGPTPPAPISLRAHSAAPAPQRQEWFTEDTEAVYTYNPFLEN